MATDTLRPTAEQRAKVKMMAALGIDEALIAKRIGISTVALKKSFARDLQVALPEMRAQVGAGLFAAAKAGNVTAMIFWLKTRAGWSEQVRKELSGPGGSRVAADASVDHVRVRVIMGCNLHGPCPKIADPDKRRALYEKILGRKLPVPARQLLKPPDGAGGCSGEAG